jgi:hypothetical protein
MSLLAMLPMWQVLVSGLTTPSSPTWRRSDNSLVQTRLWAGVDVPVRETYDEFWLAKLVKDLLRHTIHCTDRERTEYNRRGN